MAKYTKQTTTKPNGEEVVRYKDGETVVPESKVPTNVVNALKDARPGTVVDELGDPVNPETDLDDSSDEDSPEPTEDDNTDDEDDDDEQDEPTPAPKPAKKKTTKKRRKVVEDDDEDYETDDDGNEVGMGFPRYKGKTGDIFDVKVPHTHVRPVSGLMVPLSALNALGDAKTDVAPKTDVEIYQRLQELKLV